MAAQVRGHHRRWALVGVTAALTMTVLTAGVPGAGAQGPVTARAPLGQTNFTNVGSHGCGATAWGGFTDAGGNHGPAGITIDPDGRLWVSDNSVGRVLSWPSATAAAACDNPDRIVDGFSSPESLANDGHGNLFVIEAAGTGDVVALHEPGLGLTSSRADNYLVLDKGTAATPSMEFPRGAAVAPDGRLFVGDDYHNRVLIFDLANGNAAAVDYIQGGVSFQHIKNLAFIGGKLFVVDFGVEGGGADDGQGSAVYRFDGPFNDPSTTYTASAVFTGITHPIDIATRGADVIVTSLGVDYADAAVSLFASATNGPGRGPDRTLRSLTLNSASPAVGLSTALGIAVAPDGSVLMCDYTAYRVVHFSLPRAATVVPEDLDADGLSDVAVYRPTGIWISRDSASGALRQTYFGNGTNDIPVPADYAHLGATEPAVYRPSTGGWFVRNPSTGAVSQTYFGNGTDDLPVPADYDGDGKVDLAVYRPSAGLWLVQPSGGGAVISRYWGAPGSGDTPVPADYDGDGKADFAVYRQSVGLWFVVNSATGTTSQARWGNGSNDVPVVGYYDGDAKADLAVFRPTTGGWFVVQSATGTTAQEYWGSPGDVPMPADVDGDGRTDPTVFRRSAGAWFSDLTAGGTSQRYFGNTTNDIPLALPYAVRHAYFPGV